MMQHRDNPLLSRKNITIAAIVLVSIFSLLYTPVRSTLTGGVYAIGNAALSLGESVSTMVDSFVINFRSKQALVYENATLRVENGRMEAQVLDRNLLEEKVMKLEEAAGRAKSDNRVSGNVIIPFGQSIYDTLSIDVGKDHDIQNGDFVVYAGAGVIGKIAEVGATTAKVILFSSPGEESPALIGPRSVPATARGTGDGNFEAKIPQKSAISIGDKVLVSKGNLILGTVSEIEEKEGAPFATVLFRSAFNPTEVRVVEVIIGSR